MRLSSGLLFESMASSIKERELSNKSLRLVIEKELLKAQGKPVSVRTMANRIAKEVTKD